MTQQQVKVTTLTLARGSHDHLLIAEQPTIEVDRPIENISFNRNQTETITFVVGAVAEVVHDVPTRPTGKGEREPHHSIHLNKGKYSRGLQVEFDPLNQAVIQQYD